MQQDRLADLELAAGYRFQSLDLLRRALTHRSIASEQQNGLNPGVNNEQLEFLGDSVLGLVVTETLLERHSGLAEGDLTVMKSKIVSAPHLYRVARSLDLGAYLILGKGEELSGGREKKTLLADALEALIAAIYLDGGLAAAREFVTRHVIGDSAAPSPQDARSPDPKTALQSLTHARRLPPPRYRVIEETGPDHRKVFVVSVEVGRDLQATGEGGSKKTASQSAAAVLLHRLRADDVSPMAAE